MNEVIIDELVMSAAPEQVKTTPALSVTVLNYNYGRFLPDCLDSILNQTMTDFEVILINDCSTDNSLEVIQPYLADPRIKLVNHEKNKGYVASLVEGSNLSTGRYISVISADDYALDREAFEIGCRAMDADPDIVLFFSAWQERDNNGNVLYERRAANHDFVADGLAYLRTQILTSYVLHTGTLIKREAYHAVNGYDASIRYATDNNMWLMLCAVGKVAYADRPLYAYRAHETNLSNSNGAFWQTNLEMMKGIDQVLARVPDSVLPDKKKLGRRGYARALVAVPTHDIFAGRYRRGWSAWFKALRRYPVLTFCQPRTISITLRTILGKQAYARLRALRPNKD